MIRFLSGLATGAAAFLVGFWIWLIYEIKRKPEPTEDEE